MHNQVYSNYLAHHGIKGQKWGVRRFQNKNGTLTAAGKKRYDSDQTDDSESSDTGTKKFELSDKQKKALKIGAAVAATALVTYGTYKIGKSGVLDKYSLIGKEKVAGLIDSSGLKSKAVKDNVRSLDSIQKDLNSINPSGNKSNCVACSVAYVLRKMGFDVSARSRDGGRIFSWSEVELAFDDFKMNRLNSKSNNMTDTVNELTKTLKNYGEGSCGVVSGRFNENLRKFLGSQNASFDSHAFSWEVLNGNVVFSDGQNSKIYNKPVEQIFKFFESDSINYARMDNLKIDPENMMFIKALVDG